MSTYRLRTRLVDIARRDVGQTETSRNRGPAIRKFWSATTYPDGYTNREPYCAAAVAFWVREWLLDAEVLSALKMTPAQAERWRCKSPSAFAWQDWARKRGLLVLDDSLSRTLHTGDLMIFDMSHIGVVDTDVNFGKTIKTIEANTGPAGGRDGDGIWAKSRPRSLAKCFIRLLP